MSVLEGGIFSRPKGKTGGVVFGAARTRTGKKVTSRLLVSPSNPNSASQQLYRGKFSSAQDLVRNLGPSIYKGFFNRAVSQLPGFQSMESIFLNNMSTAKVITPPAVTNIGTLSPVSDVSPADAGGHNLTFSWTANKGSNGTDDDKIWIMAFPNAANIRATSGYVLYDSSAVRSDLSCEAIVFPGACTAIYGIFAEGVGDAAGLLSIVQWGSQAVV